MGHRSRFIPFNLIPRYWGLDDHASEIARAKYHLIGEELDYSLLSIDAEHLRTQTDRIEQEKQKLRLDLKYNKISPYLYEVGLLDIDIKNKKSKEYKQRLLKIRCEHGNISEREFEEQNLALEHPVTSNEFKKGLLEIKKTFDEIDETEYQKEIATIDNIPWVNIIKAEISYAREKPEFMFELDWNVSFIEELMKNGWQGKTPEDIVDAWFTETCREIFINEIDDMGTIVPFEQDE